MFCRPGVWTGCMGECRGTYVLGDHLWGRARRARDEQLLGFAASIGSAGHPRNPGSLSSDSGRFRAKMPLCAYGRNSGIFASKPSSHTARNGPDRHMTGNRRNSGFRAPSGQYPMLTEGTRFRPVPGTHTPVSPAPGTFTSRPSGHLRQHRWGTAPGLRRCRHYVDGHRRMSGDGERSRLRPRVPFPGATAEGAQGGRADFSWRDQAPRSRRMACRVATRRRRRRRSRAQPDQ